MQTPHKRSFAAEELARRKKKKPWLWVVFGIAVVAIIAGGYVLNKRVAMQRQVETKNKQIKSIAVLPFRDMSPAKDQEYLGDGIAETIISTLTKINGINVPASTSSIAFKGKELSIIEIGKQLKVETVLEGTVQKEGDFIRVTAQLIKVSDGFHLWSNRYEREMESIFTIQDSISYAIVEELKGELLKDEKKVIEKRDTENTEAYNLYLQGRYHLNKRNEEELRKGIEFFQQAIEKDPAYALAYVGIADTYIVLPDYSSFPSKEADVKAKEAAMKASAIDNTLAEVHVSLGNIKTHEWDWKGAENEYVKAIELNPQCASAHYWYGMYLLKIGLFDVALAEMKKALDLDPLSLITNRNLGWILHSNKKYDQAIEQLQKTLELDSGFSITHLFLARTYIQKSMYKEALSHIQKEKYLWKQWNLNLEAIIGQYYALMDMRKEAMEVLNNLLKQSTKLFVSPYHLACLYFVLEDDEQGFIWLEKAYSEHNPWLYYIKSDIAFESIRSDPRYKALLKKMNFPEN